MFLLLGIDQVPVTASLKVSEENFENLCLRDGIEPAPYLARHKWVRVDNIARFSPQNWNLLIEEAYNLVKG